jgi:hypothetical protein
MAVTALPLGVRYVLPMYPLLFVFGAGILTSPRFAEGKGRAVVIGLALLFAALSLRAYPDYLPYVNILAENLGEPIEWLDDSNVDWGQDLPLLAEYLRERDIEDATIVPMAWYDPGLYGVVGTVRDPAEVLALLTAPNPPAGVYAVSAHLLTRARWGTPPAIDPLTDLIPVVVLGHSIFPTFLLRDWSITLTDPLIARYSSFNLGERLLGLRGMGSLVPLGVIEGALVGMAMRLVRRPQV